MSYDLTLFRATPGMSPDDMAYLDDEQRPLLFDQDVIPLVEASSERLPGSFPVLEQWRDSRRRLAVHGANRDPRWFGASRLLVFWMGEEQIWMGGEREEEGEEGEGDVSLTCASSL